MSYRLHVYDHCPYCMRVELVLGLHGIQYERVVYNYGEQNAVASCAVGVLLYPECRTRQRRVT